MTTPLALVDLLQLDPFRRSRPRVAFGDHLLDRPVRWIHTSELAEAATLLRGEELLLTSGLGLSGRGAAGIRTYIASLGDKRAALALELGWSFATVPEEMLIAAREHNVPVIALQEVVPFVELAEAGQEAILTRRLQSHPPPPDNEAAARAKLLNELETRQLGKAALARRLSALGIALNADHYCATVIRGFHCSLSSAVEGAMMKVACGQGHLAAVAGGDLVALLPADSPQVLGRRVVDAVDEVSRSRGEHANSRVAVASSGDVLETGTRLSEARHALSLASALGITDRILIAPLISAKMVLNRLAGDALSDRLVETEIGKLIDYDRRHGTAMVHLLHTYLTHASNKKTTATAVECSRQALYSRLAVVDRLIGPINVPARHANLMVALEIHSLRQRHGDIGDRRELSTIN
jgi:hypothetical protein